MLDLRCLPVLGIILSATVAAQPQAPVCYSPERDGWSGPNETMGCYETCCGCDGGADLFHWEVRSSAGSYSPPHATATTPNNFVGRFLNTASYVERQSYCVRLRQRAGGAWSGWGPAVTEDAGSGCAYSADELCFAYDSTAPRPPVLLDAGVSGARVELSFLPGEDDGGGVLVHHFLIGASRYPSTEGFGVSVGSPISDTLGPGTWGVGVVALDRSSNRSVSSAQAQVTIGADASVPVPEAPVWDDRLTRATTVFARWDAGAGGSYAVGISSDGGAWTLASRPHVKGAVAFISVPGPCTFQRLRTSRLLGGEASAWSAASLTIQVDTIAPAQPMAPSLILDGGTAGVRWSPVIDACPSGLSYSVQRALDGGSWQLRAAGLQSTAYDDPLDVLGEVSWRIIAVDDAGNASTSPAATASIEPPGEQLRDGGAEEDTDAGFDSPRTLAVGCGCGAAPVGLLAAFLLLGLAGLKRSRR